MFEEKYDVETGCIIIEPKGIKEKARNLLIRGRFLRGLLEVLKIDRVYTMLDEQVGTIARRVILKNEQIKENRVVFYTFQGKYTCNSKYIAEKLAELHPEYEIIFIVNEAVKNRESMDVPPNVKFVLKGSASCYYALATAHYWFDNALCCVWNKIPKRKGQIYINTWHGSLGIKKLSGNSHWKRIARYANKQIDYFLTNSTFDEDVFSKSFWPDVKHMKVGHPRNDIFFDKVKMIALKKKVYEYYGIESETKTVLYAPTFRDNKKDVSAIVMDYKILKTALEKKFGGEWKILIRPHFHNVKAFKLDVNVDYIIDASSYEDMQELMAAMDVGITDYSSWIFDYIFTGRPAFIYARDIEQYVNSRGFYYSLTETPFSIASDDEKLAENIMTFDKEKYASDMKVFLENKGCYEKGTASEDIVKFIVSKNMR